MKDDQGLYYHPFPSNRRVRMYVRRVGNSICFRLWNQDDPALWEDHGWLPHEAIRQAMAMYSGKGMDPRRAYDLSAAMALLDEDAGPA